MKRDYSKTEKTNFVVRFLWRAAGGDRYLLEQATYSDRVKYVCLGGIVFATGAMAGLAGGYAFYTIFEPRGSAIDDAVSLPTVMLSLVFGVVWGLMIFNIDRFIVTSTGKGDGTEAITWDELKGALPRIIMGAIIALTISKPVEIRMFKTEIDIKLREKQLEQQTAYQSKVDSVYIDRERKLEGDFKGIEEQRADLLARIKTLENTRIIETSEGHGGRPEGEGPVARALKREQEKLENELQRFDELHAAELADLNKRKQELRTAKEKERNNNEKIANGLDGLLERIKLAHEIAGAVITTFITLLFMAIELTPVFFKLMLTKTPYDYLVENRDELIKAENGIEVRYDYYKDKQGLERHLIINHEAERVVHEKIMVTDIQKELTAYAVRRYKEREMEKIDANLDSYIQSIQVDA
ncbi:hypothetical protein HNQ91_002138 [Filimonas zeae]|uniref:DUF4407 domain-containing protein n=1 Tax=Filimonas zeae TaxID=1737353 RepID=A0A917IUU0_9BACT|nr:DUF4407 domain-containing protein [Filimonas zeae]MDR6339087.1 hypothetical protein [Filimonas zeae]GGH65170.1 hypothetical protein GCM10011379_18030 [Filimonas zeae]